MALITDKASLIAALGDHVNRADITTTSGGQWEVLIQQAEQRFQRDPRIREPGSNNAVLGSLNSATNWLITAEPDIYVYGVLVEYASFMAEEPDKLAQWEQRYQDAADKLSGSVRLNPARSLALTTYAELQTMVADALNRGDMKTVIPVCIVMAERRLANDTRVRNLTTTTYSITADDLAIPSGMQRVESWYHDGSNYYGPIETVTAEQLGVLKARFSTSGPPAYAADLNGTFRFAPAPDTTYSTKLVYWQTITALASAVNWLYTNHPHIYLWATMAECGPWVRDDAKALATVMEAQAKTEALVSELDMQISNRQFSGTLRRQFSPIG